MITILIILLCVYFIAGSFSAFVLVYTDRKEIFQWPVWAFMLPLYICLGFSIPIIVIGWILNDKL